VASGPVGARFTPDICDRYFGRWWTSLQPQVMNSLVDASTALPTNMICNRASKVDIQILPE